VVGRVDPYLSFNFAVELRGLIVAGFNEVTGLGVETEVETFRAGGENFQERQLPGPSKVTSRMVLKRGLTDANSLWSWYQKVIHGRVERHDLSILLTNGTGQSRWRWNFLKACPVKWTGPGFRATASEVAFETIELVHQGLSTDSGPTS
jgi:phage tail-like protein